MLGHLDATLRADEEALLAQKAPAATPHTTGSASWTLRTIALNAAASRAAQGAALSTASARARARWRGPAAARASRASGARHLCR